MASIVSGIITDSSKIFTTTGDSFLNYSLEGQTIKSILGATADYLPEISRFAFYYRPEGIEETTINFTNILSKGIVDKFLMYIEIGSGESITLNPEFSWMGGVPAITSGNDYLLYVYYGDQGQTIAECLYSSANLNSSVSLVFDLTATGSTTLDLTNSFPSTIDGYTMKYSGTIDWGDGSSEVFSGACSHKYSSLSQYTVTISGKCQGLGQLPQSLIEVKEINQVNFFERTFLYCIHLEEVPSNILRYCTIQTDLDSLFHGSGLKEIPSTLLSNCTQLTALTSTFAEMEIEKLPNNLLANLKNLTSMVSTFDTNRIETIPADFFANNTKLSNVEGCFQGTYVDYIDPAIMKNTRVSSYERFLSVKNAAEILVDEPLVSPEISGTWTLSDGSTSTSKTVSIEDGATASFTGTYTWTRKAGYKDPTGASGLTTDLPDSGVASKSFTTATFSASNTRYQYLTCPQLGYIVENNKVVKATGEDKTSDSVSVILKHRMLLASIPYNDLTDSEVNYYMNYYSILVTSKNYTLSNFTTEEDEYLCYIYPTALGALTEITMDGSLPVLGAFTQTTSSYTNKYGKTIPVYVYYSTIPGAYPKSTTLVFK